MKKSLKFLVYRYRLVISFIKKPSRLIFLIRTYGRFIIGRKTPPLTIKESPFNIDKTFIRRGDGESLACLGLPFPVCFDYEKSNETLSTSMKKILEYEGDKIDFGIPFKFFIFDEKNTENLRCYLISRYLFYKNLKRKKTYVEQYFFRNIGNIENLKKLYGGKKLFIITNKDSLIKIKNYDKLNNIVGTYEVPIKYAFESYKKIKKDILELLENQDKENLRIIISAGPMAKVLCFELTTEYNYICHDVGAVFDLYLK